MSLDSLIDTLKHERRRMRQEAERLSRLTGEEQTPQQP
jgi:hypothetical protein